MFWDMATTQTLQMRFVNQAGSRVTISLDNPKDTLTEAAVTAAMDQVIAKNIFINSGFGFACQEKLECVTLQTRR